MKSAAHRPPTNGAIPGTIIPYCQSELALFLMGKIACAILGPISRARFIANPVGPPIPIPIAQTSNPTAIGAIPGVMIYLFIDIRYAFIFALMILILQQFDGLYLGPKILGDQTGIKPLWVIFGITVGGAYFGVMGMFLGVPVVAVIMYLLQLFLDKKLKKKNISTFDSK